MKKLTAIILATILGISTIGCYSFANNVNNQNNNQFQKREEFKKPENEIMGKITAISENSVTISVAEFKKPENNNGEKPQEFDKKGTPPERPENAQMTEEQLAEFKKKMEEMFTLTGEIKTIDISQAKFDGFRMSQKDEKDSSNDLSESQKTVKTYKDYQVGDYIIIELTSETSNQAKSVRNAGMRGFGGPREGEKGKKSND